MNECKMTTFFKGQMRMMMRMTTMTVVFCIEWKLYEKIVLLCLFITRYAVNE